MSNYGWKTVTMIACFPDLNSQYYLLIHRQLMFEIAETYNEMADLKLSRANRHGETQSLDNHTVKKINHLCSSSAKWVPVCVSGRRPRSRFTSPHPAASWPPQIFPDVLGLSVLPGRQVSRAPGGRCAATGSGGQVQSGATPHADDLPCAFWSTGQPQQVTGELQVRRCNAVACVSVLMFASVLMVLVMSRFVVNYCAAHPEAVAAVETELELGTEMAGLLPLKINRLKARMATNNWRTHLLTRCWGTTVLKLQGFCLRQV